MKNLSLLLLAASILVCTTPIQAQVAVIQWQKCLGGSGAEQAYSIQQTTDGGYIVACFTNSNNGDVSGNHGDLDFWVVKLNYACNLEWQKCLGANSEEWAYSIQQTTDGGYIVAGYTHSNYGDVSGNHGDDDAWVVKLDYAGNLEWQKCLGGSNNDFARVIQQTTDGGYIVAGGTHSNDGDVSENHGDLDAWVVKFNNIGNLEWQKCLGGSSSDYANSIQQTTDGGYIVAGYTNSNDGDVSGNHGDYDIWVVKLSNTGSIEWQKCLGGNIADYAYSIQQTTDGGYIVAGTTSSNNGNVSGNHGWQDAWVVKLDNEGDIEWKKCLGGSEYEYADCIQQTSDGGYIVAGCTDSNDGDISGYHYSLSNAPDAWVVKLDYTGSIEWQKCLGGSSDEKVKSIQQTTDGGYIVAGYTRSNDGDVSGNHGSVDAWVVKLSDPNISGFVFHDTNLNGLPDEGEQGVAGHLVKLEPGPFYTYTNNEGKYFLSADAGVHTVTYMPVNYWYATAEENYQFSVISNGQIIDTLDFGIATRENSPDVAVYITGSPTRVGFHTHYWITYKNWGTLTTSGTVNVAFDPLLSYISSSEAPASNTGNVFTWNYGPMGPGAEHQFLIDFQVPGFDYLGETLFSHAWITPLDPDTCLVNNYDTIYQEITGSYDPNDKRVSPAGIGDEGYVLHGQKLSYTIRFQNTGNDTAFTVLVRDTLDVSRMDIETFNVETYSHPVSWQFKNPNVMEFRFNNIQLPDSTVNEPESHGFIRFSVSPKEGLPDYTLVENTANIFFDYNPPVVTNTTANTYVTYITTINPVACDSYTAPDGQVYTSSGIKTAIIPNSMGFDSIIYINLTIKESTNSSFDISSCYDYTAPDGQVYTTSGIITATIPNVAGCDSIITINLTITTNSTSTITEDACESYTAPDGQIYTTSGIKFATIPNVAGCDSIITINLTITTNSTSTITEAACESYTAPDGQIYTTSGIKFATIPNAAGCDSIITINLTIETNTTSTITEAACESYTAPDGQIYTTSGIKFATIPNSVGCDSIISINLLIKHNTQSFLSESVCNSYTAPDGQVYTTTGIKTAVIPNFVGCDSVITIYLTIKTVNTTVTQTENALISNASNAIYQWLDCNNQYSPIEGQTNQSYSPTTNGSFAVEVTKNECTDTSECIVFNLGSVLENSFGNNLICYPNPTNGKITIELGEKYPVISVRILDANAKSLSAYNFENTGKLELQINSAPGVYFIEITADVNKKAVLKVILE